MDLGKRIKLLRKEQNRTQEEIAKACNFTKSLLSKIENGKTTPPVATLTRIAESLGVKVSSLLGEYTARTTVFDQHEHYSDPSRWVKTNKGYSFYAFASERPNKSVQPYLFSVKKGEIKHHYFSHEGEEFIFMLEGIMRYRVNDIEYTLKAGDSVYFNSLEEHAVTPVSDSVKYLAIFTERLR